MEDEKIVDLFWQRSENAVREIESKYGRYLHSIAFSILADEEDSRECINDTLLNVWNSIPPARPKMLQTYMGKIARNLALDRWRHQNTEKRGRGEIALALDELAEISDGNSCEESIVDSIALKEVMDSFLAGLGQDERSAFMKRYWHFMTTREIAKDMRLSDGNVRIILHRCRIKLKELLQKEGFEL